MDQCNDQSPFFDKETEKVALVQSSDLSTKQQTPLYLYFLTVFAAIGGFLFGYDTGVISGAMILIKEEFHLSYFWQELIVSATIGTAIPGALLGGFVNQRLGRKPMLIASGMVFTVGAVIMAAAHSREVILIGRLTVGFGIGGASVTVPVYIAETAPSSARGRLVTLYQLLVTAGFFVAAVIDGIFSSNKKNGWRFMLGLAAVPSIVMFFGCLVLPESPRWLFSKGYPERAKKMLVKLRGTTDVSSELGDMKNVCDEEESLQKSKSCSFTQSVAFQVLTTSATRRALLVGCMLQAIQQLSGINTVMYYSATIIQMSGIQGDQLAIWLAAVVAFGNFAFTIVGVCLVGRMGRRKLLLASLAGVTFSLFLLGGAFFVAKQHDTSITVHEKTPSFNKNTCPSSGYCLDCLKEDKCGFCFAKDATNNPINGSCVPFNSSSNNAAAYGRCSQKEHSTTWSYEACPNKYAWMAIVGLVLYLAAFAPGMGPMPWIINSEIYPLWARSTGNAFATATNWTFNLVISLTFLSLTEWITPYGAFWLYGGISFCGWVFFFIYVPETKGKSLEELEHLFL
ncbi:hypothetical protein ACROYT_G034190 [Oculina patagonica]